MNRRPNQFPPIEHGIGAVDQEARQELVRMREFFMKTYKVMNKHIKDLQRDLEDLKKKFELSAGNQDYHTEGVEYDADGNAIYYEDDDGTYDSKYLTDISTRTQ